MMAAEYLGWAATAVFVASYFCTRSHVLKTSCHVRNINAQCRRRRNLVILLLHQDIPDLLSPVAYSL